MTTDGLGHVAPLRNVAALNTLVERLKGRTATLPGLATFYGPSGFGKTYAATYATIRHRAITVQMNSVWTKKSLCEAILIEMGQAPARGIAPMVAQISRALAISDRPLIVDEADYLVRHQMVELIRDIYEGSGAAIILIGEEQLPQKLAAWERFHGRMLDWVCAEKANLSDVAHLARFYARGVEVTSDLQERMLTASDGSVRRIVVNLDRVREFAQRKGLKAVGLDDWGQQEFFSGNAPLARKFDALRRVS